MRLSISRRLIPLLMFLLSFPLYATFISVYLVFVFARRNILADAKTLLPINRDCVHIPPTFVLRLPLSLERLSHPTHALTRSAPVAGVVS